jgi:hypothetical protein
VPEPAKVKVKTVKVGDLQKIFREQLGGQRSVSAVKLSAVKKQFEAKWTNGIVDEE